MNSETEIEIDADKIDEAALALLFLSMYSDAGQSRAWKGIDWEVMNRLYEKGYIFDPKNKAKSVVVTSEGEEKSEALFYKLFSKK